MTLRITDDADGDVLSELVIDGANTAFGPGSTLTRSLMLAPTDVNGSLVATVSLDSPLGDPVTIDASAQLSVVATPTTIRVAAVDIDVANRSVTFDPAELGVEDVDQELEDAVVEGAFLLDVVNPFGLTAVFDITLTAPGVTTIQRSSTIGPESRSTVRIDFTGDEIRSFLGEPDVVLSGGAVVDSAVGIIRVNPGEELVLSANLDLTVELGGGGGS